MCSTFLNLCSPTLAFRLTTRTKSGMLLQLNRWLIERFRERGLCVIVVDEAQNLSWELLEEIRLLDQSRDILGETAADRAFRPA